jgi:sugar lactone lactonase YvrE
MQAELVVDCKNLHGEGALWNQADARLWWTDIEGRALWFYDPESGPVAIGKWTTVFAALRHAKPVA